ncbi:MAG: hypothetical protein WCS17_12535 [Prevotella sp.]
MSVVYAYTFTYQLLGELIDPVPVSVRCTFDRYDRITAVRLVDPDQRNIVMQQIPRSVSRYLFKLPLSNPCVILMISEYSLYERLNCLLR